MELRIGYPYGSPGPRPPGVELCLSDTSPTLLMVLPELKQQEIVAVAQGESRFGVYEEGPMLFFLYRFDPAFPWSDTPYHRALEEARRPVQLSLLTERSRALLLVTLVSAEDGLIQVLRAVTLDPQVTRALWQGVLLQETLPPNYDQRLEQIYARLTSAQMARNGITCRGGAD